MKKITDSHKVLLVLGRRTGTHREDGCVYNWCIFSLSICTSVTWSNHSEINFRINSNQNNLGVGEILWCNRISAETCVLTRTHITLYLFQRKKYCNMYSNRKKYIIYSKRKIILQYLFQQWNILQYLFQQIFFIYNETVYFSVATDKCILYNIAGTELRIFFSSFYQ